MLEVKGGIRSMKNSLKYERGVTISEDCRFENVYNEHVDTVYRICFSILGNIQDAEDAVQSMFLQVCRK